ARPGDVRHVVANPARARERLGFAASVGFVEGVAAFATDPLRDAVTVRWPWTTTAPGSPRAPTSGTRGGRR
ncbi:MAG: hypothetical protein ACRDQ0_16985, partial [Pseudonocardia sp.]